MMTEDDKTQDGNENMTKLVFACQMCEKMYKKPGMCKGCNVVLKPKAA
ncbi:MAG: hypothetical protein HYS53_03395 [Candidatus Aenigmarchaeota archaeon]|nr:hypothetical protein [Candidatus Aenigmarchaeota archaeon]